MRRRLLGFSGDDASGANSLLSMAHESIPTGEAFAAGEKDDQDREGQEVSKGRRARVMQEERNEPGAGERLRARVDPLVTTKIVLTNERSVAKRVQGIDRSALAS